MMKGKMNRSLHTLEGLTITSFVNISTSILSNEETKLWHLRLSYMGERGMHELSKQSLFGEKKLRNLDFCEHRV